MTDTPNVLWIMADQLRFDYLSCYGHPHLDTPNIDALAARGVRFNKAYVQSPVCSPSRMSAYTGRYVRSHGSTWNGIPLRVGEPTLGDHLRETGARAVLVGKTHMIADGEGMAWLGIDPASEISEPSPKTCSPNRTLGTERLSRITATGNSGTENPPASGDGAAGASLETGLRI